MIEFKEEAVIVSELVDGDKVERKFLFFDPKEKKVTGWRYDRKRDRLVFIHSRRRIVGVTFEMIEEALFPLKLVETWEKELQSRGFLPKDKQ
jgi:hypothetical protein